MDMRLAKDYEWKVGVDVAVTVFVSENFTVDGFSGSYAYSTFDEVGGPLVNICWSEPDGEFTLQLGTRDRFIGNMILRSLGKELQSAGLMAMGFRKISHQ